jgi:hypothetical protein
MNLSSLWLALALAVVTGAGSVALPGCGNSSATAGAPTVVVPGATTPPVVAVAPTSAAPLVAAPTLAPPVSVSVPVPTATTSSQASAAVSVSDNIPGIIAEISTDIRGARDAAFANRHAVAADKMATILTQKMRGDVSKAAIYAQWSSAMHHVSAAARFKAASFSAWNDLDAKSKILNMEAELTAAKGDAIATQRLVNAS